MRIEKSKKKVITRSSNKYIYCIQLHNVGWLKLKHFSRKLITYYGNIFVLIQ
jgi:hypothetical protein